MAKPSADDPHQLEFPSQTVSFDPEAFDLAIRTAGVEMVHYRALPCPVGMIDPEDVRHPGDHNIDCSNGYVYTLAGTVICMFVNNSKEARQTDLGRLDGSTVQVTFPRFYEKGRPEAPDVMVEPAPFDRIFLKDDKISVVTWERFAANISGTDRLRYPALHVTDIMDARGVKYRETEDFDIVAGRIKWHDGKSPGMDPQTGKGVVCAVRYSYRPFWYVQRLMHEVRVAQVQNDFTGERDIMRMPQSMLLQREQVFENEQANLNTKDQPRAIPIPAEGSIFGSR